MNSSSSVPPPLEATPQDRNQPPLHLSFRRSRSPSPKRNRISRSRSPPRDSRARSPFQRDTNRDSTYSRNSDRVTFTYRHKSPSNNRSPPRSYRRSRSRSKSRSRSPQKKVIRCPECWKLHWGKCLCCKICGQRHYGKIGPGLKCEPFCNYCVKAGHTLDRCHKKPAVPLENQTSSTSSSSSHNRRSSEREPLRNSQNSENWRGNRRDAPYDVDNHRDRDYSHNINRGPPPLTRIKDEGEPSSYALHDRPSTTVTGSVTSTTIPYNATSSVVTPMTPSLMPNVITSNLTPVVTPNMTYMTPSVTTQSNIGSGLNMSTPLRVTNQSVNQLSKPVTMTTPLLPTHSPVGTFNVDSRRGNSQINGNSVNTTTIGTPHSQKNENEKFRENSFKFTGNVTKERMTELSDGTLEDKLNETIEKGFNEFSSTISELVTSKTSHIYEGIKDLMSKLSKTPVREDDHQDIAIQESLNMTRRNIEELTNYVLEKTDLDTTVHNLHNEIGKIEVVMSGVHNEMRQCMQMIGKLSDDMRKISNQQHNLIVEQRKESRNIISNGTKKTVEEEDDQEFITFL